MLEVLNPETEKWLRWVEGEGRLYPATRRVAAHLAALAPIGGSVEGRTIAEIGNGAGVSHGMARVALRQLAACGMVETETGSGCRWRNRYTLTL